VSDPAVPSPGSRLGAEPIDGGTAFTVVSGVAERIELCLFDRDGAEADRLDLAPGGDAGSGEWRVEVPGVAAGQRYGFRVHGPGDPANGHACDPAKLLVDPAARRVVGELRRSAELVTPGVDSAPYVPRSVVVAPPSEPPLPLAEHRPIEETVAYEAHVGHLTARHPLVPVEARGRYAGLAAPVVLDHLQRLGATAIELLPLHHFVSEAELVARDQRNVWGYNPLAWGAPHAGYATPGGHPCDELRAAVAAMHAAGLEVWLDVVVNHTCEGSLGSGPILSLRGFDNAAAYRLLPGPDGLVDEDVTGCGNAIDARSPWMRRLIRELLVRWVVELGVDGFRFDLAATLARGDDGPRGDAPLLAELAAEPALAGVRLIAEPWDTGLGGYAVGRFPAPWHEWNDRFRDDVRELWRGGAPSWPTVATRLTGSADLFAPSVDGPPARPATASINAVATHDGFTVADLVRYESPVGGGHGQRSSNGGREGPTADPEVLAVRRRRQRALLATALLAKGVPMLAAGDELGRTQCGVADGYTLEPDAWGLPWAEADLDLLAWVSAAVALRRRHPALRRPEWVAPGDPAIRWFGADGEELRDGAWTDPAQVGLRVELAPPTPDDATVLALLAPTVDVAFELPPGRWWIALDADRRRGPEPDADPVGPTQTVRAPGLVVLVDRP
jgi:glycogen operon protein